MSTTAAASIIEGPVFTGLDNAGVADEVGTPVTRGVAISRVVAAFELEARQKTFVLDCLAHADECFFVFSAMSDYDGIRLAPLILYPDVFPAYKHSKAINIASMLGLVRGYLDEESSPFHPENDMTRIQALKVILGAADLLKWKEKFEIAAEMPDAGGPEEEDGDTWWYSRYLRFALDAGIIDPEKYFRPDEVISEFELTEMITRTHAYQNESAGNSVHEILH